MVFYLGSFFLSDGVYFVGLLCTIVWSGTREPISVERAGRHKLAPRMSPNKTWEGSISGIISSALGAYLFCTFTNITPQNIGYSIHGDYFRNDCADR